jgi:hypothetical protein
MTAQTKDKASYYVHFGRGGAGTDRNRFLSSPFLLPFATPRHATLSSPSHVYVEANPPTANY